MSPTAAGSSDSTLTPAPAKKKRRRARRLRMSAWAGSLPSNAVAAGALDASARGAGGRSARDETPDFVEPSMGPPLPIATSLAPVCFSVPNIAGGREIRAERRMTGRSAVSGLEGRKRALDPTPGVSLGRTLNPGPWTDLGRTSRNLKFSLASPCGICILFSCANAPHQFPGGAVVAQLTVNQRVVGSNPTRGARLPEPPSWRLF